MESKSTNAIHLAKDHASTVNAKPEPNIVQTNKPEVITAVTKKRYKVLAYNKYSQHLTYETEDGWVQIICDDYDGSGFIEVE